jgi:pyruvate,orthophosphate dikinase
MPGMLDTVLNAGATHSAARGLVRMTGNPRFAFDCARRFVESYAAAVLEIEPDTFSALLDDMLRMEGIASERDLDGEALERLVAAYRDLLAKTETSIPEDPMEQLARAARAVYRSWTSERARTYRALENLGNLPGTAVTVQAMVFGNRSLRSGAGVVFSRDPSSGAAKPVIEMLFAAQGEDVVSGCRQPETEGAIGAALPDLQDKLADVLGRLEQAFQDVQDVEFTVEEGRLWILQTRAAKRTPQAAVRFAIDLVRERLIEPDEALRRLEDIDLSVLARKSFADPGEPAAIGIPVSSEPLSVVPPSTRERPSGSPPEAIPRYCCAPTPARHCRLRHGGRYHNGGWWTHGACGAGCTTDGLSHAWSAAPA